jgi:hypothetical protein
LRDTSADDVASLSAVVEDPRTADAVVGCASESAVPASRIETRRLDPGRAPAPGAPEQRSANAWAALLSAALRRPITVEFGRSRTQPIRLQRRGPNMRLRLHGMFASAPDGVVGAVLAWMDAGRRAPRTLALLDDWIDVQLAALPALAPPAVACGDHHDLGRLAEEVLATALSDAFDGWSPAVVWGRRGPRACRSSLLLGSYNATARTVRIHPVLDRPDVPDWFVRFIVFHELLHAALPPGRDRRGRRLHHPPEFRRRERAHPDYERAVRWEAAHIRRLIRLARALP